VNTLLLSHVGAKSEVGHAPLLANVFSDTGDDGAASRDGHAATGFGEAFGDGAADSTARPGYQRVLSLKDSISSHRCHEGGNPPRRAGLAQK
jgi:hypothetical protein